MKPNEAASSKAVNAAERTFKFFIKTPFFELLALANGSEFILICVICQLLSLKII